MPPKKPPAKKRRGPYDGLPADPVTQYAVAVCKKQIVAGRRVTLQCERHIKDLRDSKKKGAKYVFDYLRAERPIEFIETYLKHSKGKTFAGNPFILAPWQIFVVGSLFGWINKATGLRRFKRAYIEVARKNGKSTLLAAIMLYLLLADGEAAAEVYSAATTRDQAKIVFNEAKRMIKASGATLGKFLSSYRNEIQYENNDSFFQPLSAEANSLEGLNIHAASVDELHAHKTREVWDVLDSGTGGRSQPLLIIITTAGDEITGICYENREYCENVLNGLFDDDEWFMYIASIDSAGDAGIDGPGDDALDPAVWIKANPNIPYIETLEADLETQARKAQNSPASLGNFKIKRCNVWTNEVSAWLDLNRWNACEQPLTEADLVGRLCYGGLDLSSTDDLSALVWLFPPDDDDEPWYVLPRAWIPSDNVQERARRHRVPYQQWISDGLIRATPGDIIDQKFIEASIAEDAARFNVIDLAVDRAFQAGQIMVNLQEDHGIEVTGFGMGYLSMAAPTRELEVMIGSKAIAHNGDPVLRWNISNTVVRVDPAGNMKPDKAQSRRKIDLTVALLQALGVALKDMQSPVDPFPYQERGIRSI